MTFTDEWLEQWKKEHPDLVAAGRTATRRPSTPDNGINQGIEGQIGRKTRDGQGQATGRHKAIGTWSDLVQRMFDSRAEARRGEELWLMQLAGEIEALTFQMPFTLCEDPKITISIDFAYVRPLREGEDALKSFAEDVPYPAKHIWKTTVYEDVKGRRLTKKRKEPRPLIERDFKVKLAWLKQKYGVEVKLIY